MGDLFKSPEAQFRQPPVPDWLRQLIATGSGVLTRAMQGVPGYTGPFQAPQTEEEKQALEQMRKTAGGGFLPTSEGANPYIKGIATSMEEAANRMLSQQIARARQQFSSMGLGTSTPLLNVEGQIAGQAAPALAGQLAGLYGGEYESERGRQEAATRGLATFGAVPREILTAENMAKYQEWLRQQEAPIDIARGLPFGQWPQPQQAQFGAPPAKGLLSGAGDFMKTFPHFFGG